jgi:uncharacterized phage protein (TIGR01671 family)
MEREIKFRGISDDSKEFIYGGISIISNYKEAYIIEVDNSYPSTRRVLSNSVGQFTGLKDKNGVDIYEGDILKLDDEKNMWIIEYFGCGFRGKATDKNYPLKGYFITNNNYLQFEVIGNIHENKDLLNN